MVDGEVGGRLMTGGSRDLISTGKKRQQNDSTPQ